MALLLSVVGGAPFSGQAIACGREAREGIEIVARGEVGDLAALGALEPDRDQEILRML